MTNQSAGTPCKREDGKRKGVLIVAHGSRQRETEAVLEAVAAAAGAQLPRGVPVRTAFMEFSPRSISVGLTELVEAGATEIVVCPYFLFDGVHIREDIPRELEKFGAEHPHISIRMAGTLGADPRLAELLADRIREAL